MQDSFTIEEPAIKKQEEEKKLEVESSPEEVKELEDENNLEERQTGTSNLSKNNRQEQ